MGFEDLNSVSTFVQQAVYLPTDLSLWALVITYPCTVDRMAFGCALVCLRLEAGSSGALPRM